MRILKHSYMFRVSYNGDTSRLMEKLFEQKLIHGGYISFTALHTRESL